MEGMDDGRKEAMRRRMNELDASGQDIGESRRGDAPSSSAPYRNNRRARMRAKKTAAFDNDRSPSPRSVDPPKSRLDEVPFWREGGSIASLLFENRPSSSSGARDGRHPNGRKSLEVRLFTTSIEMCECYLSCRMAQIAHAPVFIIPRVETATAPLAFRARAHCHLPLLVRVALRPDRIRHHVQVGRRSRDHTPTNRRHVGDRGDPQFPGGSKGAISRAYLVRHAAGGRIHPREFARQRVLGR